MLHSDRCGSLTRDSVHTCLFLRSLHALDLLNRQLCLIFEVRIHSEVRMKKQQYPIHWVPEGLKRADTHKRNSKTPYKRRSDAVGLPDNLLCGGLIGTSVRRVYVPNMY